MRRLGPLFATLAVSTSIAVANPPAADKAPTPSAYDARDTTEFPIPVAFAVNAPSNWSQANVGLSVYVAVHEHHSLRINVADYEHADHNPIEAVLEREEIHSGRTTDIGAAWQYFPRSVWSGPSLELGVLHRKQDTRVTDAMDVPARTETDATGYAARGLIGWSWLGWTRVFLAAAVGASVGRYAGTEATAATYDNPMFVTNNFARAEVIAEAYLRFGIAFGL